MKVAKPRAAEELAKTAQQKEESHKEEEAKKEVMLAKERKHLLEWEIVRKLEVNDRVESSEDLKTGLKLEGEHSEHARANTSYASS